MKREKEQDDIVIKVHHVSKDFKVYFDRANTLKERILFLREIDMKLEPF